MLALTIRPMLLTRSAKMRNQSDSCFLSVEGGLITDRKVHGSGNKAKCVDLLMQRGCEFQIGAFL
jgi:hypothetical protein